MGMTIFSGVSTSGLEAEIVSWESKAGMKLKCRVLVIDLFGFCLRMKLVRARCSRFALLQLSQVASLPGGYHRSQSRDCPLKAED